MLQYCIIFSDFRKTIYREVSEKFRQPNCCLPNFARLKIKKSLTKEWFHLSVHTLKHGDTPKSNLIVRNFTISVNGNFLFSGLILCLKKSISWHPIMPWECQ